MARKERTAKTGSKNMAVECCGSREDRGTNKSTSIQVNSCSPLNKTAAECRSIIPSFRGSACRVWSRTGEFILRCSALPRKTFEEANPSSNRRYPLCPELSANSSRDSGDNGAPNSSGIGEEFCVAVLSRQLLKRNPY